MNDVVYTKFPNLHSTSSAPSASPTAELDIFLPTTSRKRLYQAWTRLLQAYAGEKLVVFASDNRTVITSDEDGVVSDVVEQRTSDPSNIDLENATGIFWDNVSRLGQRRNPSR